jgi:hypothetical protein
MKFIGLNLSFKGCIKFYLNSKSWSDFELPFKIYWNLVKVTITNVVPNDIIYLHAFFQNFLKSLAIFSGLKTNSVYWKRIKKKPKSTPPVSRTIGTRDWAQCAVTAHPSAGHALPHSHVADSRAPLVSLSHASAHLSDSPFPNPPLRSASPRCASPEILGHRVSTATPSAHPLAAHFFWSESPSPTPTPCLLHAIIVPLQETCWSMTFFSSHFAKMS